MREPLLKERIAAFIESPESGDFDVLAGLAFDFQVERIEAYRRLCAARGIGAGEATDWRRIPPVPTSAFKRIPLAAAPARRAFRSSGTTRGAERRSVHYLPFPELYLAAVDASFPRFCLPPELRAGDGPPMLSLIPPRQRVPDSSLSFMIDHVLDRWAGEGSEVAFSLRGVDERAATRWARERQGDGRPVLVLATALALQQWLDHLAGERQPLCLPAGSVVFETGGFKGRERSTSREQLLAGLERRLGVAAQRVVREYGMTELSSQFYTRALAGGDPDLFVAPHWTRVEILDPLTLEPARRGEPGLLTVLDLANLGSALRVLTEDLGRAEEGGFRLLGRAAGAELRGCSLTAEEMSAV